MRGLYQHIPTGKMVFLTSGEYEVNGRVSNFYSGKVLNENGELSDETLGDYGRRDTWKKIEDYKIKIEFNQNQ